MTQRGNDGDMRSGMERAMGEQADSLHSRATKPQPRASMGVHPETSMVQERRGTGSRPKSFK